MRSSKEANYRLHWVAEAQAGWFTAKQTHYRKTIANGRILRQQPNVSRAGGPRGAGTGVYSHSTALGLYSTPKTRPIRCRARRFEARGYRRRRGCNWRSCWGENGELGCESEVRNIIEGDNSHVSEWKSRSLHCASLRSG